MVFSFQLQAGTGIEEMEEEEVSVETVSDDMTHDSMPMDDRVAMNNGPTLGENLNTMEEPKREMPGDSGLTNSGSAPMPDFFVSSPNLLPPLQFATGNQVNPINLPGLQGTHTRNHKIFSIPTSKGFDFDDSFNVNGVFSASGRKNDGVTITGLGTGSATIIGTKNDHIQFVKPDILGSSTGDLNVQETFNIGGVGSGSINKARIADNSFRFNRQLGFANFGVGGFVKENINVNGLGFLGRVSGVFNQDKGGDFNLATPFGTLSGRSNTVCSFCTYHHAKLFSISLFRLTV